MLTKLLEKADVMVDNFRPGVLDRLGFSEENLRKINPRLICASLTGFGHTGPYREKAAYDLVVQGYGGIMSVTGQEGGPPTRVGVSIGDLAAGLYLTIGIIGSLLAREKTGRGDRIDVAMLDCQVALLENSIIRYIASGEVPKPVGNRHPSITPFEVLPSKDGYITVCVGNEKNWKIFCQVLEHPELITDPRFLDNDLRTENHAVLSSILGEIMRTQTTKEWIAKLDEAGVPCGSVNNIKDVLEDEQVKARNMIISIDYPKVGTIQAPGCPIKSREYPVQTYKPSPFLGQDNEEIFKGLGFSEEDLKCLKKDKII
jgi:CoA:oxalate CoA-transferase